MQNRWVLAVEVSTTKIGKVDFQKKKKKLFNSIELPDFHEVA